MLMSLDCETTGVDPWHGSKPFLVTIARDDGEIDFWEWEVNPINREPKIPAKDKKEIQRIINKADSLVLQNAKFDARMLKTIGIEWDWNKVYETLFASHLLNSGQPKDLTFSCLYYLGIDIGKYNNHLKKVAISARRIANRDFPEWRLADKGLEDMPSANKTIWKGDLWLSKLLYQKLEGMPEDWDTCTADYANADSEATLLLFKEQRRLIKEKGLWEIYLERLKNLKVIYDMENTGVSYSQTRLEESIEMYGKQSAKHSNVCLNLAESEGYDLVLPKSGNNQSLIDFVFDELKLKVVKKSKKTGKPSLDKEVMQWYKDNLPRNSIGYRFIKNLREKRKRDTAISYMVGYERFRRPLVDKGNLKSSKRGKTHRDDWFVVHPALNPADTYTLRCASKNPNSQSISKQKGFNLRYAFGPAPGREWWSIDYNNLELRLTAYESGEDIMIELFERPKDPPFYGSNHLLNASIIYPDMFKKCGGDGNVFKEKYPMWYRYAKEFGFAVTYGAQLASGTADRAARRQGSQVKVINRLKKHTALNDHWIEFANEHGYVETIPDKTVDPNRGYPVYCPTDRWGKIPETKPLSNHIQSTGGWVIMKAMVRIYNYLPPGYYMIMQVHDELVFDFPKKSAKINRPIIEKCGKIMEQCGDDIGIPLTCGIDYHPHNWSQAA